MIVTGLTKAQIVAAVARANEDYDGNIVIQYIDALSGSGLRHTVKLGTADSYANGSRVSWSGRHGRWLCWHGFRDVIRAMFVENPDAKVYTAQAKYIGADGFEVVYPATAETNVGSMVAPAYMPELCVGPCAGDWE